MSIVSDRTLAQYIAWAHAHPVKHQGGPWATPANSWCEQLVNNAGNFGSDSFPSAALAGSNSGGLDPRMATAGVGEFVYWTNHVGVVTSPGVMFCASQSFVGNGTGYGYMKIADYSRLHPTQKWRGHSRRHGDHLLNPGTTVTGNKPVPVPVPAPAPQPQSTQESEVPLVRNYKNPAGISTWFRTYEFTQEETQSGEVATLWKAEAGQGATISANGDDLNAARADVKRRVAAFAAQMPTSSASAPAAPTDLTPVLKAVADVPAATRAAFTSNPLK